MTDTAGGDIRHGEKGGRFLGRCLAVCIIVIVAAAIAVLAYVLVSGNLERRFRDSVRRDWGEVERAVSALELALARLEAPADLSGFRRDVKQAANTLRGIESHIRKRRIPSGCREVAEKEEEALRSMVDYLEMAASLSDGNSGKAESKMVLLLNRERKAKSAISDFLMGARFLRGEFPGVVFTVSEKLSNAYRLDGHNADENEKEAVYNVLTEFMDADIKKFDIERLWSNFSSRKIQLLELTGVGKESLAEYWMRAREDDKSPVDFYINKSSIEFSNPTTAALTVIVYYRDQEPKVETVRLLKEATGWKIDGYPFIGWL